MKETVTFLERVLPAPREDARFILCAIRQNLQKKRTRQELFQTPEALAESAFKVSGDGRDAYMALAIFDTSGYRKAAHALAARSLWLDLDSGKPGVPYATRDESLEALGAFVKKLEIPEPLLVNSGNCVHVYWPLTEELTPADWRKLAFGLKAATKALGLVVDPQRTADIASVLRVPGTVNYKGDPVAVSVMSWGAGPVKPSVLARAFGDVPVPPSAPSRGGGRFEAFPHATLGDRRDRDPVELCENCAQMLAAGTPSASRKSWFLMLGAMGFCEDGLEAAHVLSQQDPDRYQDHELERQFASYSGGPPRCSSFEEENPGLCLKCRHRGRVSSPVQLGRRAPPARAEASEDRDDPDEEPDGAGGADELEPYDDGEFRVVPGTGLVQLVPSKFEGEPPREVLINRHEFYLTEIHADTETLRVRSYYIFKVKSATSRLHEVELSMSEDFSGTGFGTWLGNNRLMPVDSTCHGKAMRTFMGRYLASLQDRKTVVERKTHFGWAEYTDLVTGGRGEGFVAGRLMYTREGPRPVVFDARCERMAKSDYISAGTLDKWKAVPDLYRVLEQPEGQLFMCASFAAPFMKFGTGTAVNLILALWDARGGKGKTSLLQAVNSVWGHPTALLGTRTDSVSARYQVLTVRRNLVNCMDEFTNMKDTELSDMLYAIGNGRERKKSKSSGDDLVDTGSWSTITCITSNRSVYELMRGLSMQTTAESMRIVEIPCRFRGYSGTEAGPVIERILRVMNTNYGLAGPEFMRRLMEERFGAFDQAAEWALAWDTKVRKSTEERFWTYGLGLILAAGRLACEMGFLSYDMDALERWVTDNVFPKIRSAVSDPVTCESDIMTLFLNENLDSTLVVLSHERSHRAHPASEGSGDGWILKEPSRELHIRMETDTRTFYLGARHFEAWCRENRVSVESVLDGLAEGNKFSPETGRRSAILGRGISRLSRGQIMCYVFKDLEVPDGYASLDT